MGYSWRKTERGILVRIILRISVEARSERPMNVKVGERILLDSQVDSHGRERTRVKPPEV